MTAKPDNSPDTLTRIPGKDEALEISIQRLQTGLQNLGFNVVEKSWLNPVSTPDTRRRHALAGRPDDPGFEKTLRPGQ